MHNGHAEFVEYPKWLYDKTGAGKVCPDAQTEEELGADWQFTPGGQPLPEDEAPVVKFIPPLEFIATARGKIEKAIELCHVADVKDIATDMQSILDEWAALEVNHNAANPPKRGRGRPRKEA